MGKNAEQMKRPSEQKKSPFSAEFIDKIKGMLMAEKTNLERDLNKFAKKNPHTVEEDYTSAFPDYGDKDDENAAEVAEYETNLSIEQTLEKKLRDVNAALQKIVKGEYGICKHCGKPIEEKRLLARPDSGSHVECKEAITLETRHKKA